MAKKSKADIELLFVEAAIKGELGKTHREWLLHLRQYVGDVGFVER